MKLKALQIIASLNADGILATEEVNILREAITQLKESPQDQLLMAHLHIKKGSPTVAWVTRYQPAKLPEFPDGVTRSTYPLFMRSSLQRDPKDADEIKSIWTKIMNSNDYSLPSFHAFMLGFIAAELSHDIKEKTNESN